MGRIFTLLLAFMLSAACWTQAMDVDFASENAMFNDETNTSLGVVSTIVPIDTVAVTLDNTTTNAISDYTQMNSRLFYFTGMDQSSTYQLSLRLRSTNHVAGVYPVDSVLTSSFYKAPGGIDIDEIKYVSVTGDASACSAYVELIATDSIYYKLTFIYTAPVIDVVCTRKQCTFYPTDNDVNILLSNDTYAFYFDIYCEPGRRNIEPGRTYTLANDMKRSTTGGREVTDPYYGGTSVIYIVDASLSVDTAGEYTARVVGVEGRVYDISYVPVPIVPVDTVDITMDNQDYNMIYGANPGDNYFQLIGSDQSRNHYLSLYVYSDQLAGTYTIDDVVYYSSDITYLVGDDVYRAMILDIQPFTVTGNAYSCSTYLEILGSDSVLYRIAYTLLPKPKDLVCQNVQDYYSSQDTVHMIIMTHADYQFAFALDSTFGSKYVVDGQTYTLANMRPTFSFGYDYNNATPIVYQSATFQRINRMTYIADVTDTTGRMFHITYTPIYLYKDTVDISMENTPYNRVYDWTKSSGRLLLMGADQNDEYEIMLYLKSYNFAGGYVGADVDYHLTTFSHNDILIDINCIDPFTVVGDQDSCSTYIQIVSTDSTLYRISYSYIHTPIVCKDTINVLIDNSQTAKVVDLTLGSGLYQISGNDRTLEYSMGLTLYSPTIDGTFTDDDVYWDFTWLKRNGAIIDILEINNIVVTGDANSCNAQFEVISSDSVMYRVTFSYPGTYYPITPVDTIDIIMNSADNNVYNLCGASGFFQLEGYDQNKEYRLLLGVYGNSIAGSYTHSDVYWYYTGLTHYVGSDAVYPSVYEIRNFTITGNSSACNTVIEWITMDSVLFRMTFSYTYTPSVPVDTVEITFDSNDPYRQKVYDYTDFNYFRINGATQNLEYTMSMVINSNHVADTYANDDIDDMTSFFYYDGTYSSPIVVKHYNTISVTGNADTCSAYIEFISINGVLYKFHYTYQRNFITPVDTVDITMDNHDVNIVYNHIATESIFEVVGADQNENYFMSLKFHSTAIAGTYRVDHLVYTSWLMSVFGNDTNYISIQDMYACVVTGDASACTLYAEILSADSVLYRINFTYAAIPSTGVVNSSDETDYVVYNEGNSVVVNGAEGETMAVYDMSGKMIATIKAASDVERIVMPVPGVYVVRIGKKAVKALVRW